jgi:hypothetical protein
MLMISSSQRLLDFPQELDRILLMTIQQDIAKTILSQIGSGMGGTLMCIGMHKPFCLPQDDAKGILGGVTFKVNPNPKVKVKATVTVTLKADDTYHVNITTCRGKVVLEQNNVYCDDLGGPNGLIEQTLG